MLTVLTYLALAVAWFMLGLTTAATLNVLVLDNKGGRRSLLLVSFLPPLGLAALVMWGLAHALETFCHQGRA